MAFVQANLPDYSVNQGGAALTGKDLLMYMCYHANPIAIDITTLSNVAEAWATYTLVGATRSDSISVENGTIDATTKADEGYTANINGTSSWTASTEIVVKRDAEIVDVLREWAINKDVQKNKPALACVWLDGNTHKEGEVTTKCGYVGWVTISSVELSGSYDDVQVFTAELANVGPLKYITNIPME